MRFKEIIAEQADSDIADVILFFQDGSQHILNGVPRSFIEDPNFEEKLRSIVRRNFSKIMVRYEIGGEGSDQGKKDDTKSIDAEPDIAVSKQDTEKDTEKKPNTVKAPANKSDRELEPQIGSTVPIELFYKDPDSGDLMNYAQLKQKYGEKRANEITNRGGGSEGERGDSGEQGEPGGGLNQAEAEDLAKQFYDALNPGILGLGTDEVAVVKTFKKIKNPQQLFFINKEYKKKYGEALNIAIQSDYSDASDLLPKFNKTNIIQRAQLNRELNRLGYEMTRGKIVKKAGD